MLSAFQAPPQPLSTLAAGSSAFLAPQIPQSLLVPEGLHSRGLRGQPLASASQPFSPSRSSKSESQGMRMLDGGGQSSRRAILAAFAVQAVLAAVAPSAQQAWAQGPATKLGDDEFAIQFGEGSLGIDLIEVRFPANVPPEKQSSRIIIDAIKAGSQAETLGKPFRLRPQILVVSVNGKNIEGLRAKEAIKLVIEEKKASDAAGQPTTIVFRDPLIFKEKLLNSKNGSSVSTQVGVGSSELLVINTTFSPGVCGAIRTQQGDLLELRYTGYLADTMEVFDGSNINQDGGYFGDQSIYFVLNQGQNQAPRGWEVGLLGMCIGEKRRLTVPPSLAYGKRGVPKGKIIPKLPVPPNAVVIYDIELLGINGINYPTEDATALGTRIPYDYQDCKVNGTVTICGPDVAGRRL